METSSQIGPRVVYIGEILNNIGNFTLSAWLEDLPTELSALGSALASNLLVKIDDGIRKPDVTLLAEDKWTATFSIAPRELSLSFLPPGRNASSAVPGPFVIPLPRTIDTRSARISGSYASIEAKFALAAGPDSSNSWRREIQVHYPLSAAKLEQARGISCARCSTQLLRKKRGRNGQLEMPDEEYFYRTVDLPSEHWMELVECWMCHQEDYGRGGRFEKSTQASPGCLSVGASYVLLSGDDLDFEAVTVDSAEDEDGKPKVSDDSGLPHAIGEERKTNEDGQRKPVAALCASRRYCLPRWNFALKNVQRAELCREGYLGSVHCFVARRGGKIGLLTLMSHSAEHLIRRRLLAKPACPLSAKHFTTLPRRMTCQQRLGFRSTIFRFRDPWMPWRANQGFWTTFCRIFWKTHGLMGHTACSLMRSDRDEL